MVFAQSGPHLLIKKNSELGCLSFKNLVHSHWSRQHSGKKTCMMQEEDLKVLHSDEQAGVEYHTGPGLVI